LKLKLENAERDHRFSGCVAIASARRQASATHLAPLAARTRSAQRLRPRCSAAHMRSPQRLRPDVKIRRWNRLSAMSPAPCARVVVASFGLSSGRERSSKMTKPFSVAFKQKMIERLVGKNAVSARRLSREVGVSQETLSRWL